MTPPDRTCPPGQPGRPRRPAPPLATTAPRTPREILADLQDHLSLAPAYARITVRNVSDSRRPRGPCPGSPRRPAIACFHVVRAGPESTTRLRAGSHTSTFAAPGPVNVIVVPASRLSDAIVGLYKEHVATLEADAKN